MKKQYLREAERTAEDVLGKYAQITVITLFALIGEGKIDTSVYTIEKAALEQAEEKLKALASGEIQCARVLLMPNS